MKRNHVAVGLISLVFFPLVIINALNLVWKSKVSLWCYNFLCAAEKWLTGYDIRTKR